jgi:methoxymalonate biosynthesis acyl carrier protein
LPRAGFPSWRNAQAVCRRFAPGNDLHSESQLMSADEKTNIRETVRHFVLGSTAITQLNDDENLFELGIVNSLFAVQLMTFIEKTFQIEVGIDDLDMENFKSIKATTAFVLRKNGGVAA